MTAKMSASRKKAFLKALRATGNQTVAAERVGVSRSWVSQQRAADPEFRRESDEAIREAKESLERLSMRPSTPRQGSGQAPLGTSASAPRRGSGQASLRTGGSNRPPRGLGHLDGVELVVRGSGGSGTGRRVQIARARAHQWTARVEERFLAALKATCNVKAAYTAVGMSKGSAYTHRRRWPDFARRWDEAIALGYERLEGALRDSAFDCFVPVEEIEPDAPVEPMTVAQVLHYLGMHRRAATGRSRAPGRRRGG